MKRKPRFQDLSREQAFGLEARILQRLVPLLQLSEKVQAQVVGAYFGNLFELTYVLADISLGNLPLGDARKQGREFHAGLGKNRLFVEKSIPAAEAILCVTDALGELELIRYFPRPGLSERDKANPDVVMLLAGACHTLSKIGMLEEVFMHPSDLDLTFIFDDKLETDPFLAPHFFSRDLWPLPGLYSPDRAMPHAFESVILEDWRESLLKLHLTGIVASYDGLMHGIHLTQKHRKNQRENKTVINNVTLNFSNGSSFTGPLAVGENIRVSYDAAASTGDMQLRDRLENLVSLASKLTESIDSVKRKNDVSLQLKSFVEEAKKEKPSKWMLDISSKGLLDAANTVAAMASPITSAVKAVLALVAP